MSISWQDVEKMDDDNITRLSSSLHFTSLLLFSLSFLKDLPTRWPTYLELNCWAYDTRYDLDSAVAYCIAHAQAQVSSPSVHSLNQRLWLDQSVSQFVQCIATIIHLLSGKDHSIPFLSSSPPPSAVFITISLISSPVIHHTFPPLPTFPLTVFDPTV